MQRASIRETLFCVFKAIEDLLCARHIFLSLKSRNSSSQPSLSNNTATSFSFLDRWFQIILIFSALGEVPFHGHIAPLVLPYFRLYKCVVLSFILLFSFLIPFLSIFFLLIPSWIIKSDSHEARQNAISTCTGREGKPVVQPKKSEVTDEDDVYACGG